MPDYNIRENASAAKNMPQIFFLAPLGDPIFCLFVPTLEKILRTPMASPPHKRALPLDPARGAPDPRYRFALPREPYRKRFRFPQKRPPPPKILPTGLKFCV